MKHTLILFSALVTTGLNAQDQLYKKDNTKLDVKILEVGPSEIKYKLHSNLNGPTYIESKQNVNVIIYQSGQHEVISHTPTLPAQEPVPGANNTMYVPPLEKFDSLSYYRYNSNISINFLNFFNNEVGLIYQREFFKSHFNIIIPFAIGIEKPSITQSVYFDNRMSNSSYTVHRKMFETGFGIHYYPSLRTNVNYFIGPVIRYIKYDGTQMYYSPTFQWPVQGVLTTKNTSLTRIAMTITNGFVIRTRSRLTTSLFGSIGFKQDEIDRPIVDATGQTISGISKPMSLYFWTGFNVGFNF